MQLERALYLVPVEISGSHSERSIPPYNMHIIRELRIWIVEDVRTARRCLRRWFRDYPIDECTFYELSEHTNGDDVWSYLQALREGKAIGLMSEAGCPGVADPGAIAVSLAQKEGLKVVPLVGPSSILLSLMGSGFNGQGFTFNGYLPVKEDQRIKSIKELESKLYKTGFTQIFIEAPYRNNKLVRTLASVLRPDTLLCVAADITDSDKELILTLPAFKWRKNNTDYDKRPAIFLIGLNSINEQK